MLRLIEITGAGSGKKYLLNPNSIIMISPPSEEDKKIFPECQSVVKLGREKAFIKQDFEELKRKIGIE